MPLPVWLPRFDPGNEQSRILSWLVDEGRSVLAGDALCEVETDKVNMEVEAPADGRLGPQRYPAGTFAPAASVIAWLMLEGEEIGDLPAWPREETSPSVALSVTPAEKVSVDREPNGMDAVSPLVTVRPRATPAARHLARVKEMDLSSLRGSGPRGRIQASDVRRSTGPGPGAANAISLETTLDMSGIAELQRMWPAGAGALTHLPLVARACVLALGQHPGLNVAPREGRAGHQEPVNPGFVIGTDEGQVVAVLHGAEQMSMRTLLARCGELVGRAHESRLTAEERSGDSFRICDLGAFGVNSGTIRVTPPLIASLGLGRVVERIVPDRSGQPVLRPQITLSLSLASGPGAPSETEGARFLQDLCATLEQPLRLLL